MNNTDSVMPAREATNFIARVIEETEAAPESFRLKASVVQSGFDPYRRAMCKISQAAVKGDCPADGEPPGGPKEPIPLNDWKGPHGTLWFDIADPSGGASLTTKTRTWYKVTFNRSDIERLAATIRADAETPADTPEGDEVSGAEREPDASPEPAQSGDDRDADQTESRTQKKDSVGERIRMVVDAVNAKYPPTDDCPSGRPEGLRYKDVVDFLKEKGIDKKADFGEVALDKIVRGTYPAMTTKNRNIRPPFTI